MAATYLVCARHQTRYQRGGRCPACRPARTGSEGSWRTIRRKVIARDGQCMAVEGGVRCPITGPLEAHHLVAYADGGTDEMSNLIALCSDHHRAAERARRPR